MSSPGSNGGAAREDDPTGLGEPLLTNDDAGGFHTETLATVVVAATTAPNGNAKVMKGSMKAEAKDDDRYWVDVHREPNAVTTAADLESGGDGGRPLMFREKKVLGDRRCRPQRAGPAGSGGCRRCFRRQTLLLLSGELHWEESGVPHQAAQVRHTRVWSLILTRLVAVILFIGWRIKHNNSDVMWFWTTSVVADVWFTFSWLLYQMPKFNPIKRSPDLDALRQYCDLPDGGSILPAIDVFVTTADPIDEPVLYTMNSVLSILAVDYPIDRYACYLSDDSGTLIEYDTLVETANFAALWAPFCRKHSIEPRAPESYFQREGMIYTGKSPSEFINDYRHVQLEYQQYKARLEMLTSTIRERSDFYNSIKTTEGAVKVTWMANGTQWPGTWFEPIDNHRKGHHEGVVQVVLEHPNGSKAQHDSNVNPLNFDGIDARLPMLVYMARGKSPCYDHNKKAGNLNAQLRTQGKEITQPWFSSPNVLKTLTQQTDMAIQGPSYLSTSCMFRRLALCGIDPPRWRPNDIPVDSSKFGNSIPFLNTVLESLKQESRISPLNLDDSFIANMMLVVSSSFDIGTDWGRGVGYIYEMATEDMVTGFRIHKQGWHSMYCTMDVDTFRGTAPINLTERLYQIVRWAGGSVEMFFSHNNPLLVGWRLHPMQRTVYLNYNIYPITSLFLLLYALCPVMWLLPEEILIQRPFTTYVVFLIIIIALIHTIGIMEIKWAGTKWLDWWRNEQFFMIASLSAYPTALLHIVVKLLTRGKGIRFRVTSKQTKVDDNEDKYAEMYEMRWVPMLIPAMVVLFSNTMAIGVAIGKAIVYGRVWPTTQRLHAMLGLLFNVWLMILLQPFALAVIGRWSKKPSILFILFPVAFVVFAWVYICVHVFVVNFFSSMEI
ncbi:unnamed protein product [Miscanthus lutarioriparius]|uniref:Uncharacterized protein n=1 Tax=Miscanthus lutarioriparius TaxID=422564 RepID=A0A811N8W2_9POAL|nr:unnamed protein product [Miscanthus lutarioriparius]